MFETTLVGNQPKIFDDPARPSARPNLRLARNQFDKGTLTASGLEEVIRATIKGTLDDQASAGLDWLTDGRIRWDDPVTPFAMAHEGFSVGGLIRFFDNNVYYRRPTITGPIRFVHSAVVDDFLFARGVGRGRVVPSVCGPFSLAKFCVDEYYHDSESLYADCARLVRVELEALALAGADWIQVDEPYLGRCPDQIRIAVTAISAATEGIRAKTFVYTYFSPIKDVINELWDLPIQAIGADCATVPANFDVLLRGPKTMGRGFGLLDARTTRLESPDRLVGQLDRLGTAGAADWPACFIAPSAGLEFLPYPSAIAKMRRLVAAVCQVLGVECGAAGPRV
jgi:5-methyltetrahydropteroyltriglutamate--homocysteine methyltransferase